MKIEQLYELYKKFYLVDTDTRNIRKNSLFFALKGDSFNGNKFAQDALQKGARFAIIDDEKYFVHNSTILVDDALKTLQDLANFHRHKLKIPIIGLTGSNGKTTTKELINAVLSKKYKTTATKGNLNNHIGVPLTLLSIDLDTEIGIIEMGANHQKEIAFLSSICEPDYGYITNFGKAHLEGFGGVKGVIKGKSELYDYIRDHNKTVFINPNDTIQLEKTKNMNVYQFEKSLSFMDANPFVQLSFQSEIIKSNLIGKYNYNNIAIACTIGNHFNVSNTNIKEAIESYIPSNNRSQVIETDFNKIILDAYNANPTSVRAALESFSNIKEPQKTVIIGDMFELGKSSTEEHQAIAILIEHLKFNNTFLVGANFYKTKTQNRKFNNFDALQTYLKKNPLKHQSILIKGSRGMRLERLLDLIN